MGGWGWRPAASKLGWKLLQEASMWFRDGRERRQSSLCTIKRAETGDRVRSSLIWEAYAATWGHVIPRPVLPLRAMSGSMAPLQQGSVLMSVTHVTSKGHEDVDGLDRLLRTCWWLSVMLNWSHPSLAIWLLQLRCGLGRARHTLHLGSVKELASVAWTWEAHVQGLSWPTPKSSSPMSFWSMWRGQSCRTKAIGSPGQ